MSFEGSCPACGNGLTFRFETSVLAVCPHCNVAVARRGADLKAYGRVADPLATPTQLALDVQGRMADGRGFTIAGRLQLDWGAGAWDEWHLAIDDGSYAWLAEAQGRFYLMKPAELPSGRPGIPPFSRLPVGQRIELGKLGQFVVTERRAARYMTAQGQLPDVTEPGSVLHYADLSGRGGYLATLDYGDGDTPQALYLGKEMTLADLGIDRGELPQPVAKRVAGQKLSCTQCGGPLPLRAPDETQRVCCAYCGALLDATGNFEVLEILKIPVKPAIPLGKQGQLGGVTWTVIGFMVRSTVVEGMKYPWREYLLHEPAHGFAWLVESSGHWSFVEGVAAGDVEGGLNAPAYDGKRYKHFQTCKARVDQVLGEFYWTVKEGEKVAADDYVSPPHALSREKSGPEVTWSHGTYVEPEEVWAAFGMEGEPPEPAGVGASQPWMGKQDLDRAMLIGILAVVAMGLAFLAFRLMGKEVHRERFVIPAGAAAGSEEAMSFSQKFEVPVRGNVEVRVEAPVSNSWLYLDGALINEAAGVFTPFDMEISYYSGSDWKEGSTRVRRYLGSVAPGTYELRFSPQWDPKLPPGSYEVTVSARKPRLLHLLLATLLVMGWPLILAWQGLRFEHQRWSESDHPMFKTLEED